MAIKDELLWFKRLRRVLEAMPETVELQVHQRYIQMNKKGARAEAFERMSHADDVDSIAYFETEDVYPCSESI